MKPRFSIIIPVYNRAKLVKETIDSVFAQTFTDFELVAIDDGSKDNSLEVLRSYGDRLKVIHQSNQGPEAARYKAIAMTCGEYYVILDSDDLLMPNALATYDQIIRSLNAPPVIIGAMTMFRSGTTPEIDHGQDGIVEVIEYENLFVRDRPIGTTCSQIVAKREVVEAAGSLRPTATAFPFDLADILLTLSTHGPWVTVQRPTTIAYRIHESNTIGNLAYMVKTAPCLIRLEKLGKYPGGGTWRFSRWAYLGGVLWNWCQQALTARQYRAAAGLILKGAPMIACGMLRKMTRRVQPRRPTQRLGG